MTAVFVELISKLEILNLESFLELERVVCVNVMLHDLNVDFVFVCVPFWTRKITLERGYIACMARAVGFNFLNSLKIINIF